MSTKPTVFDDAILLLALWVADDRAALVGTVRTSTGELIIEAVQHVGQPWPVLAAALHDAQIIGASAWIVLCNDPAMVQALQHPWVAPTQRQQVWVAKGEYVTAGVGGDPAQWEVYQRLGMHGRWTVVQTDQIQKARTLWQEQQ